MEAIIEFVEKCTYEELANVGEKERKGILYYYEWAALIALEIMLAFSAWGYIRLDYVSITFVPCRRYLRSYRNVESNDRDIGYCGRRSFVLAVSKR